jgi:hypothetical protein
VTPHRVATAIAAVLAAASLTGCGSDSDSATTARPGSCAAFGATDHVSGAAAVTREPAVALLANVQVQASDCIDEISFLFMGGIPGWSVGYHDGPLTEDPSGRPVDMEGASRLVVRFEPAAGVDLAQDQPIETYDGPTAMKPPEPSGVTELRRLGDFEAVTSWAIGLPGRRPFEVVTRDEQLVIRLPATSKRTARCTLPGAGLTVGYPGDWFTELSDRWVCSYFDPAPFVVHPATNDFRWAVTVQLADASADEVVARSDSGGDDVTSSDATVAGLPATVLDIVSDGTGLLPSGYGFRMYIVDTGSRAVTIMGAAAPPGQITDSRAVADRIARLVEAG